MKTGITTEQMRGSSRGCTGHSVDTQAGCLSVSCSVMGSQTSRALRGTGRKIAICLITLVHAPPNFLAASNHLLLSSHSSCLQQTQHHRPPFIPCCLCCYLQQCKPLGALQHLTLVLTALSLDGLSPVTQ